LTLVVSDIYMEYF